MVAEQTQISCSQRAGNLAASMSMWVLLATGKATEEDRDKLMNQRICPPACWCRGQHLSGALTGNLQQKLVGTTDPLSSHTTLACARASLA